MKPQRRGPAATAVRVLKPWLLNRVRPARQRFKWPRNAPCPCGSGKKFKHCCGRR